MTIHDLTGPKTIITNEEEIAAALRLYWEEYMANPRDFESTRHDLDCTRTAEYFVSLIKKVQDENAPEIAVS